MSAIRLSPVINAVAHIGAVEVSVVRMVRKAWATGQMLAASDHSGHGGGQS